MSTPTRSNPPPATELLIDDHRCVDALFDAFDEADHADEQAEIVTRICRELTVHAELEEKLLYPASRDMLRGDDQDLVDEAFVEHASLKGLMMRLDGMKPSDALFKAYVTVLKEYVQHHVKEEEKEYFPKLRGSDLDLRAVGARMLTLKQELTSALSKLPVTRGKVTAKLLPGPPLEQRAAA